MFGAGQDHHIGRLQFLRLAYKTHLNPGLCRQRIDIVMVAQMRIGKGFVRELERHRRYGGHVLGICGGMQMLGADILDNGTEGGSFTGLGWLPLATVMQPEKTLRRIDALARWPEPVPVTGYEIHHGESEMDARLFPFAAESQDKKVSGTYVHGLFESGGFRKAWLAAVGGPDSKGVDHHACTMASLDMLADTLERELNPELLAPLLPRKMAA